MGVLPRAPDGSVPRGGVIIESIQSTFDELGTPLRDVTFVVVDLETTGGSAADGSSITEVGAVKVRQGDRKSVV